MSVLSLQHKLLLILVAFAIFEDFLYLVLTFMISSCCLAIHSYDFSCDLLQYLRDSLWWYAPIQENIEMVFYEATNNQNKRKPSTLR